MNLRACSRTRPHSSVEFGARESPYPPNPVDTRSRMNIGLQSTLSLQSLHTYEISGGHGVRHGGVGCSVECWVHLGVSTRLIAIIHIYIYT